MSDDDAKHLVEISQQLKQLDLEAPRAERIASRARQDLGRRRSLIRFGEPILVVVFTTSFLVWALMKVLEVFR